MTYDCVIIGSGVAGLTAALYLARAKKNVMIIEDGVIGGTTATLDRIDNYPGFESISGFELIQRLVGQVMKYGVNIDILNIKEIDFNNKEIILNNSKIQYKSLIIASGTSYKKLNIEDESKYQFKGLSYCAVCDGNLFKNKNIVVVTNGNTGKESIDYLSNLTDKIIIVDYQDKYVSNKFKVYNNAEVININGDNLVDSIDIKLDKNKENIKCDGLFVALGKETNLKLYKDNIDIKDGYIVSDENMHTNIDGVFVAGDVRLKSLRQIITACSDGAIAGTEAIKYLQQLNN